MLYILFVYVLYLLVLVLKLRDFIEISDLINQKLDELKVVTQPVKMIRTLDPFKPKIEQCK